MQIVPQSPQHHLASNPSSLSLALPHLPPQAIFLPRQIPGNRSMVWEAESPAPLTQTLCYKSTLFFPPFPQTLTPHRFLSTSGPRTSCQTHSAATYTRHKHRLGSAETHGWSGGNPSMINITSDCNGTEERRKQPDHPFLQYRQSPFRLRKHSEK